MPVINVTILNPRENLNLSAGTVVKCKTRPSVLGPLLVECYHNNTSIGCIIRANGSNSRLRLLLPKTDCLTDEMLEQLPNEFEATIVASGIVNHGVEKVGLVAKITVPDKVAGCPAENETETEEPTNPLFVCKQQLSKMNRDELIQLAKAIDKELVNR